MLVLWFSMAYCMQLTLVQAMFVQVFFFHELLLRKQNYVQNLRLGPAIARPLLAQLFCREYLQRANK